MARKKKKSPSTVIGWREWIALPELDIERIKVKVDTGARSSSLHAYDLERFEEEGRPFVRFNVHPVQRDSRTTVSARAELVDRRSVRSSSGAETLRPVIQTEVVFQDQRWAIELTLTRRDDMGFRMLLGRQAVRGRFLVDPGRSFVGGR